MIFNKSNVYFLLDDIDMVRLSDLCNLINSKKSELKMICSVSGKVSTGKNQKMPTDYRLYVGLREGTVEKFSDLIDILEIENLFCSDHKIINSILKRITLSCYSDYSNETEEEQYMHAGTPIRIAGTVAVTSWNPHDPKFKASIIDAAALNYHRDRLRPLCSMCSKRDECGFYPWKNIRFNIVPSETAKDAACGKLKVILDKMTPKNPNWTVKYDGKACCSLKCESVESAEVVRKKVSAVNRQTERTVASNVGALNFSGRADISIETPSSPVDSSVYVIIKDELLGSQIELHNFGMICTVCRISRSKMSKCSVCRKQYYCSEECQTKDWPVHKKICKSASDK